MSNKNCGPDIVKYFVVEPSSQSVTGSTGDFYVCQGTTFLKTISGCTDSVNLNDNIFYNDGEVYFNNDAVFYNSGDVYFNGVLTACTGIHTSNIYGCSPVTVHDRLILLSGLTLTTISNDDTLTQLLARDSVTGEVKYRDAGSLTILNTFVTGTTFSSNQATLTRNDNVDVLFLTGGTNVTLSNPSTNQIKIDVSIPADTNTFVTGFTYDNVNTFTVSQNDGSTFDATISVLSGITYYGDGSNLTGISTEDKFVTGGTYNTGTQEINFAGNSPETTFDVDLTSLVASVSGDTNTFVTGFTFNNTTYDLTIKQNNGEPDLVSNLAVLASDVYVVSGVYNPSTGIVTYTNSSGGTFQVSGFTTGMTDSYTTDAYLNGTEIRFDNNIQGTNFYNVDLLPLLSGKTDNSTFNSYTANTQTILDSKIDSANNVGGANEFFKDKSGTTLNFRTLSGGSNTTVSTVGDVVKVDVTIPADTNTFVTGGTYSDVTDTITLTRNDGGTIEITGVTDTFTTGATYDNGTALATFTRNDGNTYTLDLSTIDVNDTFVTGTTFSSNQATLTRNDGVNVLFLTGGTNVTLSNPTTNQIKIDVNIPTDTNSFSTGGTVTQSATSGSSQVTIQITGNDGFTPYNITGLTDTFVNNFSFSSNTFTITQNDGSTFEADVDTIDLANILSAVTFNIATTGTISATTFNGNTFNGGTFNGTFVGDGSGLTGITDNFVSGGTYNNSTNAIDFVGNSPETTFSVGLASLINNVTGDTFVTGTTFSSNEATLTRNDGFNVLSLSGANDVTLTNPSTNQIVIDVNGLKYFISETSPTGFTLSNGYRWFNTSIGSEFVYIDDGDSSQWVQPLIQPGPEGPIGPQGPVGPQGPSGFTGVFITTAITTSAATLTTNYTYYGVNYLGNVDLTLPDPTGIDGFNFTVKDEGGNAGTYRIRLIPSVGLIDGNSSVDMANNYQALYLVARNNNWWII
jgi:hypothetical protein